MRTVAADDHQGVQSVRANLLRSGTLAGLSFEALATRGSKDGPAAINDSSD
jgi:hypothetical protein